MIIKVFKLTSGEEVLSEVRNETETSYSLLNPAQIAIQPREDGSMGLVVAAFQPYAEGAVTLYKTAVVTSCIPAEGLCNEYKSKFTDEPVIQVPDRKIII
jgi:hypothetical protein